VHPRTRRASPLPPHERRTAILRAVRPVLLERGAAVTTKELAQAAGVAEGTLFRVFEDKLALVREAVLAAVDPADDVPAVRAIPRDLPLEDRVRSVMEIGLARSADSMRWMSILHEAVRAACAVPGPDAHERMRGFAQRQEAGQAELRIAVEELLAPDAARFARPLVDVVDLMTATLMGVTVLRVDAQRRGTTARVPGLDVLADHFLHGALARPTAEPGGS